MRGLVIKSTGSSYIVRMDDGTNVECHIKGNFRIRGIRSTNPVAVGDYVIVESQKSKVESTVTVTNWIKEIEDRKNYIIRKSTNLSKESHILAANVDQVALIVTVNHPVTSTTFIDRLLATCEAYRVRAILIFNKIDLLTEDELAQLAELRALYESIGYPTLEISATSLQNSEVRSQKSDLFSLFEGKTTLLSGNSGVGKSTLLNALFGKEMTRTGKISDAHDKGMHTTTFSEMYFLEEAKSQELRAKSRIIDTPGIKGFGTIDFQKDEVSHYFREIFAAGRDCRFGNCTHTNEPGCAVQDKLITGDIAISRYESYLSILNDATEGKYRG
ncbi:MAG: ribosome small subunit-dependent GTPase A [Paludibacteraceae bacterium]|nr:ribosome small subunit-dependent GTPase A [Paludibacteraceae bacterium]